jgi:hypothetical protein
MAAWYRVFQRFKDGENTLCITTSEWKNAKLSGLACCSGTEVLWTGQA